MRNVRPKVRLGSLKATLLKILWESGQAVRWEYIEARLPRTSLGNTDWFNAVRQLEGMGLVVRYGWKRHYWYALAETAQAVEARENANRDYQARIPEGLIL